MLSENEECLLKKPKVVVDAWRDFINLIEEKHDLQGDLWLYRSELTGRKLTSYRRLFCLGRVV